MPRAAPAGAALGLRRMGPARRAAAPRGERGARHCAGAVRGDGPAPAGGGLYAGACRGRCRPHRQLSGRDGLAHGHRPVPRAASAGAGAALQPGVLHAALFYAGGAANGGPRADAPRPDRGLAACAARGRRSHADARADRPALSPPGGQGARPAVGIPRRQARARRDG